MGKLISVEESNYVTGIIDQYAQNKVGQYSKYLNLTPTFVTYYAVNQIMSKADTGTGTVAAETGYNSPLRFNKIKGLPVYNLPILSPDIDYDETGMDLNLELNDITLLPNTVKPTVPDYMVVTLSPEVKVLFRVNSFRYNTIMSNDFVSINLDIKKVGPDVESTLEPLVVKTYYTIFDNIGTEDKCFIEEEAVSIVNDLVSSITELSDTYRNLYWDTVAGGYLLHNRSDDKNVIYDVFLNRFINDTDIFPHQATTITTLPYLDYVPAGYDKLYRQSLLYAVNKRSKRLMSDSMYYYLSTVTNPFSPLKLYHYDAYSLRYLINRNEVRGTDLVDYYDHLLKYAIRDEDDTYPMIPVVDDDSVESDNANSDENDIIVEDYNSLIMNDQSLLSQASEEIPETNDDELIEEEMPEGESPDTENSDSSDNDESSDPQVPTVTPVNPYIVPIDDFEESEVSWKSKHDLTEQEIELINSYTEDQKYIFNMIIQYMKNIALEIDVNRLVKPILTSGRFSYFYTPIVIYIMKSEYDRYFSNPTTDVSEDKNSSSTL